MPTTPNGTVYVERSFTSSAGDPCKYGVATAEEASANLPLMFYVHGYGGDLNQFSTSTTWAGTKNWLIDNGWAYVEGNGAGNNWGNTAGRTAYQSMWNYMDATLDIGEVVIIGRSMGGLIGYWLYTQDPTLSTRASGLVVASGVTDLTLIEQTGTFQQSIWDAYGATSTATFATASVGHDPIDFTPTLWDGKKIIQVGASGDLTVPPAQHGYALQDATASRLALSERYNTTGGDHNSSTGGDPGATTAIIAFMETVTTPAPAAPGVRAVDHIKAWYNGQVVTVTAIRAYDSEGVIRDADMTQLKASVPT